MTHLRHERALMRLAERFQLNPSNWLPHLPADGLYEMGTRYSSSEEMFGEDGGLLEGEQVPIQCFSLYNAFWLVCYDRRQKRGGEKAGFLEELWSFLSDVNLGVYDTTNWVPVGPPEGNETQ